MMELIELVCLAILHLWPAVPPHAPHLYLDLLAPETFSLLSLVLFLSNSTAFDLALHVRDMFMSCHVCP
jgi:hypothetical protein